MARPVEMILIGAGNRGSGVFGQYALDLPHMAKFTAVVEPDKSKRENFALKHCIPPSMALENLYQLKLLKHPPGEAVVIATLESERIEEVEYATANSLHILVEKPLGCNASQVVAVTDIARDYEKVFIVCHQMRHAPVYEVIKSLIVSGRYGKVVSIQHSENLSWHHIAHSFVRGLFNNDRLTPMIIAKSCHDMDLIRYFVDSKPLRVSSFGSLTVFRQANAPEGAPEFCLDGCPAQATCPYDVLKIYFNADTDPAYIRQMGIISSKAELMQSLRSNCFGRCVYRCDNNVVDHQVVQIEFENGVTAAFEMSGPNFHERRMTKIAMTNGEIQCDLKDGVVMAYAFEPMKEEIIRAQDTASSHAGGDRKIMDSFVQSIMSGQDKYLLTPVRESFESHIMGFAAEESRKTGSIIDLTVYEQHIRAHGRF